MFATILLVPTTFHSPDVALLTLQLAVVTFIVSVTAALTVTCCEQVAVKPALSLAAHCTVVVPKGNVAGALLVTVGAAVRLSVAVGVDNACPCIKVTVAGQLAAFITGTCVSMLNAGVVPVAVPPALEAVQVRVWPAPLAVTVAVAQPAPKVTADWASVTVQVTVTGLIYQPFAPTVPVRLGTITGGVVSAVLGLVTVTVKLDVPLFPALSLTEQLTVVVPTGKDAPDAGKQLTPAALMPDIASVAVGNT